jgi:ATP-dependent Lon protease
VADADAGTGAAPTATIAPTPSDALIVVPVRSTVLFPGLVLPIAVGRPRSIAAAQQAMRDQRQLGILMQRNPEVADPGSADMHRVGCIANLMRYVTAQDGTHHLACQGEQRFRVLEFLEGWPFLVARVARIPSPIRGARRSRPASSISSARPSRPWSCCRRPRPTCWRRSGP